MKLLPFKLALFSASLILGVLAVMLFIAEQSIPTVEKRIVDPTSSKGAKPKKVVCSLGRNTNDGKSCKCEEFDE